MSAAVVTTHESPITTHQSPQHFHQPAKRSPTVAQQILLLRRQLRKTLSQFSAIKNRIVSEPSASHRRFCNTPLRFSGNNRHGPALLCRGNHADKIRIPFRTCLPGQLAQQLSNLLRVARPRPCVTRRKHSRCSAQRRNHKPRIIREHQPLARPRIIQRFPRRIFRKRRSIFRKLRQSRKSRQQLQFVFACLRKRAILAKLPHVSRRQKKSLRPRNLAHPFFTSPRISVNVLAATARSSILSPGGAKQVSPGRSPERSEGQALGPRQQNAQPRRGDTNS